MRINLGIFRLGGVGVDANLVAEFAAADHGVHGRVVDLACEVPEGHFNRANSAALPGMSPELFDLAEKFVELQRILADNTALQKKRIRGAGAVAHLAEAVNTLVGINANDRTRTRSRLHHVSHAQIGNLQRGGTRIRVHRLGISL